MGVGTNPGRPSTDLTGAVLTFADEFDRPSITGPDGDGPWFTPIHGGFGLAAFLPPFTTEPPFYFDKGVLTIRLAKRYRAGPSISRTAPFAWRSGTGAGPPESSRA